MVVDIRIHVERRCLVLCHLPSHAGAETVLFELHVDGEGLEVGEEAEVAVARFGLRTGLGGGGI